VTMDAATREEFTVDTVLAKVSDASGSSVSLVVVVVVVVVCLIE
jgi:low affinity Fe/Cu permease